MSQWKAVDFLFPSHMGFLVPPQMVLSKELGENRTPGDEIHTNGRLRNP